MKRKLGIMSYLKIFMKISNIIQFPEYITFNSYDNNFVIDRFFEFDYENNLFLIIRI